MNKILIVEDDEQTAESVCKWLEREYLVESCSSGDEGLHLALNYAYDLLILDWELPTVSGLEILKQYRGRGGQAPVLMLTGRTLIDDKEAVLESGADDYLIKPFSLRE